MTFSYTYNCRLIVKPGHDVDDNPPLLDDPFLRKITTFKETSRDIIFAEENILPNLPFPINDAFFVYDDVTGNRHMGQSEVSYLDGHSDDVPPAIPLFRDRRYFRADGIAPNSARLVGQAFLPASGRCTHRPNLPIGCQGTGIRGRQECLLHQRLYLEDPPLAENAKGVARAPVCNPIRSRAPLSGRAIVSAFSIDRAASRPRRPWASPWRRWHGPAVILCEDQHVGEVDGAIAVGIALGEGGWLVLP